MNVKRLYLPGWIAVAAVLGVLIGRSTVESTEWRPQPTVDAGLDRSVEPLHFDGTPLRQALAELGERSKVSLLVAWRTLEAAGIASDAPVDVRTPAAPVKHVLEEILDDTGGGMVKLAYRVREDGTVRISTAEDLEMYTVRVYDVRDLVEQGRSYAEHRLRQHPKILDPTSEWTDQDFLDELIRIIQEGVVPDLWRDVGGPPGYIAAFSGQLVVIQTERVHEEIRAFLRGLRDPEKP